MLCTRSTAVVLKVEQPMLMELSVATFCKIDAHRDVVSMLCIKLLLQFFADISTNMRHSALDVYEGAKQAPSHTHKTLPGDTTHAEH